MALLTRERGGPIPRPEWTTREARLARRAMKAALDSVGEPQTDTPEDGDLTVITRRQCSDDERRQVLERYLMTQ